MPAGGSLTPHTFVLCKDRWRNRLPRPTGAARWAPAWARFDVHEAHLAADAHSPARARWAAPSRGGLGPLRRSSPHRNGHDKRTASTFRIEDAAGDGHCTWCPRGQCLRPADAPPPFCEGPTAVSWSPCGDCAGAGATRPCARRVYAPGRPLIECVSGVRWRRPPTASAPRPRTAQRCVRPMGQPRPRGLGAAGSVGPAPCLQTDTKSTCVAGAGRGAAGRTAARTPRPSVSLPSRCSEACGCR